MFDSFLREHLGNTATDLITHLLIVIVILALTGLARKIITAVVPRVVHRLTRRTETDWDDRIVAALQPPARLLVTLIGLWSALIVLELPQSIQDSLSLLMNSLVAFSIFWAIYRLVEPAVDIFWVLTRRTMRETGLPSLLDEQLSLVIKQIGRALVIILGFATIVDAWGYNIAGLVAGLGIGGLAVALAAQDTVENLIGYFLILADEPFQVGDFIVFNGIKGTVETLGFRSTRIRMPDQGLVTVPNNTIMQASITNWSRLEKRRLDMTLGLEYGSSPEQILAVVQAIREMLKSHERVEADSVVVQFVNFNDSWLDILIIGFVNTPAWADFQATRQDINLKIMQLLDEHGVSIAFPSQKLYVQAIEAHEAAGKTLLPSQESEPATSTAPDPPPTADAAH